ncbi:hypothetical protein FB451DRAFT_773849 [Mycena latifolia]|nr:hypothetical protein FB451DRAFT_773849 [Mycena latifolia]
MYGHQGHARIIAHIAVVAPWPKSALPLVHLHLFIPAVASFAVGEKIPFRVQLTGPVVALRAFLPTDAHAGSRCRSCGNSSWGTRVACVSPPHTTRLASTDAHDAHLECKGEIQCRPDIQVGTFDSRPRTSSSSTPPTGAIVT